MTNQHPITPPTELVEQWRYAASNVPASLAKNPGGRRDYIDYIATQAVRWGADMELEACVKWIEDCGYHPSVPEDLRTARRPEPPSLNSIALQMLGTIERDAHYIPEITDTIRRALEQLPN